MAGTRLGRWPAVIVVAALLAMHGMVNDHSSGVATMSVRVAMSHQPHMAGVAGPVMPAAPAATATHTMSGTEMCLALAALLLVMLLAAMSAVRRRSQRRRSHRGVEYRRPGRGPPCPPPHVRGVCLT